MDAAIGSVASAQMRKLVAITLALLLGGVVPAAATMIGFCADLPCCVATASAELAVQAAPADCCDEIACAEPPVQDLGLSAAKEALKAVAATALHAQATALTPVISVHPYVDAAPPRTSQQRLSTLSVLLI